MWANFSPNVGKGSGAKPYRGKDFPEFFPPYTVEGKISLVKNNVCTGPGSTPRRVQKKLPVFHLMKNMYVFEYTHNLFL